jgi:hypothetical protein
MLEYVNELGKILRCAQDDEEGRILLAFRESFRHTLNSMRTYLRIFNPMVALLVFILCSFAAMKEDKDKPIVIGNVLMGGIPTYFFAKGMFCGVALILLGKILENQLGRDDGKGL